MILTSLARVFAPRTLHSVSAYNFARKVTERSSYKERKDFQQESKPARMVHEHDPENRVDPNSVEIDDEFLSLCQLGIQHLPERFLKRTQQVFSKFPHQDLRAMGKSYMKLYQLLHATEKPMNLTEIKPFINTDQLTKDDKKLVYLGKKRRFEEDGKKKSVDSKDIEKNKEASLKEKLTGEEDDIALQGRKRNQETDYGISYDRDMTLAYMLKKMPHTFGVACRVFSEIKYRMPDFKPKTFLDFGAGLGSGSWGFKDIFQEYDKIIAVEPSTAMRKLGKHMTQDVEKILWLESLAQTINISSVDLVDFVYCGYVLEEASNAENRQLIIDALWNKLAPGGIMVLIEPGSPKGFRFIHDFREWIRSKPRDEASIVAPCPHHDVCPQAEPLHLWCNFEQRIGQYPSKIFAKHPRERLYAREKFSYLVVKKGEIISSEANATTPAGRSYFWDRLIRPSMKRSKHIIMDVCSTRGKLERVIIAKSHGVQGGYKHAKSVKWGDLWPYKRTVPNKFKKESRFGKRLI